MVFLTFTSKTPTSSTQQFDFGRIAGKLSIITGSGQDGRCGGGYNLNLQDTLALIFFAIIPLGLVGGIILSRGIEREQGKEAAEKYNIPNKDKVILYLEGGGKLDFIASEKNRERLDEILRARVKNLKFEEQL
jgi:hypothetical protein